MIEDHNTIAILLDHYETIPKIVIFVSVKNHTICFMCRRGVRLCVNELSTPKPKPLITKQ